MSATAHIDHLTEKHAKIEHEIHDAYLNFLPDNMVHELKKKKLVIKQQIEMLKMKSAA